MIEVALGFQVLVWLVVLGVFLASGQASIFHPLGVYWGFHGLVFVIRPLLVHFMGFNSVFYYMGFNPSPQEFITTLAVTSLGLVVLAATCLWFGRVHPRFTGSAPSLPPDQSRALPIITLLLLPVIAYSIYRAAGDTGGERAANGIYILTKTTGYVVDAQFMVAPLICLWLVKTRFHWLNLVPILLYVAYRSWVGSARWTFLLFFITLVFQYCWYRRLRWLPRRGPRVIAVPVLILFNVVGQNRELVKNYVNEGTLDQEQFGHAPGQSSVDKRKSQLDTQDFANFDYLAAVISIVPERTGTYNYGLQYLQLFTEPIPRILWPGKPAGAPVGLVDISPYVNFLGLTFSLVGDGWVSGGWTGVIITMGIAGILLGLAHRFFWTHTHQVLPSLFFIGLLSVSPNWFRDGGISVFKFLLWTWSPFIILPVVTWLITSRAVPGTSITIRPGERLRIVRPAHQ